MKKLLVFSALGLAIVLTGCSLGTPKAEQGQTQPTPTNEQGAVQTAPVQNQTVTETPSATPKPVVATPAPTPKPVANSVDCGTSRALENASSLDNVNVAGDNPMICMGEKILKNCENGQAILMTPGNNLMKYIINGKQGDSCLIRLQMGSADQIPLEASKKYADTYIECPISISMFDAATRNDPAKTALAVYLSATLSSKSNAGEIQCHGTFYDVK